MPYTELAENRPGLASSAHCSEGGALTLNFCLCARGNLSKSVQKRRHLSKVAPPRRTWKSLATDSLSEGGKPLLEFLIGFVEPSMILAKVSEN